MVIGSHENGQGRVCPIEKKVEIDKELSEIQAQMETLSFNMQQEEKMHSRYEWPLKRTTKWPVQKLLTRRKKNMLRRWLRHVENLSDKGRRSYRGLVGC
jgi:hypothetical protein